MCVFLCKRMGVHLFGSKRLMSESVFVTRGVCIPRHPLAHVGFSGGRLSGSGGQSRSDPKRGQSFLCTRTELCEHTRAQCVYTKVHKHSCSEGALGAPAHTLWAGGQR